MAEKRLAADIFRDALNKTLTEWRTDKSQHNAEGVMFWAALAALTAPEVFDANVVDVLKTVDASMSDATKSGKKSSMDFWCRFGAEITESIFRSSDLPKKAFGPRGAGSTRANRNHD